MLKTGIVCSRLFDNNLYYGKAKHAPINEGAKQLKKLEYIRNVIDDCDKKLVEVFERRLQAVLDVLKYKKKHGLPIFHPKREQEILNKVDSHLKNNEFTDEVKLLYRQILKISRKLQSQHLFPTNIVLIGFMGSGKTSVGTTLAALLEMNYIDTDNIIVEDFGTSVNEIFGTYGEARFRKLETEAIRGLKDVKNTVISCGGGVILNPENIELLKNNGTVVWLKVSPEEAYERLLDDSSRPLLENVFTMKKMSEILESRLPLYENSGDIAISTDGREIQEIAEEIIEKLLE